MRRIFFLILLIFLLTPVKVYAASISLSTENKSLPYESEIEIKTLLSINSQDGTTYYLRGVFSKPSTTDYCGLTWNGKEYYSGPYSKDDKWKNFLPIVIQSSSWSGTLKVKIDPSDSGCKESGNYNFKIERFTNSGSGTFDSQQELNFNFTIPTKTPTPIPTSKPTQIPKENFSPTQQAINNQLYSNNTQDDSPFPEEDSQAASVSGTPNGELVLAASAAPQITENSKKISKNKNPNFSGVILLLLSFGILCLSCGILLFQKFRKKGQEAL